MSRTINQPGVSSNEGEPNQQAEQTTEATYTLQPTMGDVVSPPEERLALTLQGIDQILGNIDQMCGDLHRQLASFEKPHDRPADDDVQIQQMASSDQDSAITIARETSLSTEVLKAIAEGLDEDAPREASSRQLGQSPAEVRRRATP